MDTEGPVSVLDHRVRSTSRDRVIADRITRQRSPGPSSRNHRSNGVDSHTGNLNDEDSQEELIYRISQPYRTSFSAKHSVTWGKVDRSRSLSPTSSLRSDLSYCSVPPTLKMGGDKRRTRGQSKSPKRVTYNTRVTVRHSDTEDSVFTELSSYECDDDDFSPQPKVSPFSRSLISPKYNEFSQLSPVLDSRKETQHPEVRHHVRDITNMSYSSGTDQSFISRDSGLDYSAELKDLSERITKMNWSPKNNHNTQIQTRQVSTPTDPYFKQSSPTSSSAPSPPGILKTSQGFYENYRDQHNTSVRSDYDSFSEDLNLGHGVPSSRSSQSWSEEAPDGPPRTNGHESPKEESYQPQLKDDATSSSPGDTSQGDTSPGRGSPVESGRLTPSKRSVSLSITSFLKRVSPHFRRKRSKDRNKKSSSAESSAQSLATTSDPETDLDITAAGDNNKSKRSGRFSRNNVRQSFLKLVGGSSSRNKKKKKAATESSHYTIEPQDPEKQTSSEEMDEMANGFIHKSHDDIRTANGKSSVGQTAEQITRSAEITKTPEQESPPTKAQNPHQFSSNNGLSLSPAADSDPYKDETTPVSSPMTETIRASTASSRMEFFTESDINAILCPSLDNPFARTTYTDVGNKQDPKDNVHSRSVPPNSLDVMPARTKRLLQTSMMSSISGDESIGDCSLDINLTASEPSLLSQSESSKQVVIPSSLVSSTEGPPTSDTGSTSVKRTTLQRREYFTQDSHDYQQPVSKSRSDPSSPVDPSHKPSYLKLSCAVSGYGKYSGYSMYKDVARRSPCSSQSSLRSDISSPDCSVRGGHTSAEESISESKSKLKSLGVRMSGHDTSPLFAVNGHVPSYPTGDTKQDGEYFLKHTQFEEERLKSQCMRAETYTRSHDLPDEVSGKIRAAIGKANLLISQKFIQFRDLCQNHMQRSPDERETKWEDLQGFWDIVRIQIDSVDDMFAEIELMRENGWQEVLGVGSKYSSASSSPKSGTVSQNSTPAVTPSHTPGSKRRNLKQNRSNKNTPDSSPDEAQKARQTLKARDEARKKLLSEKRAAMKLATTAGGGEPEVEIFLQDLPGK